MYFLLLARVLSKGGIGMKLKIGEKVYLQKYDVAYILNDVNSVPASIFEESLSLEDEDGERGFFFMDGPRDSLSFECAFERPGSIKWLMEQEWILDYEEYAETPLAELEAFGERLNDEYLDFIREFNAHDDAYREKHLDEESEKKRNLEHKISSVGALIALRQGKVKFSFPDEYQDKAASDTADAASIPKKKPGFFARLFSRNAQ